MEGLLRSGESGVNPLTTTGTMREPTALAQPVEAEAAQRRACHTGAGSTVSTCMATDEFMDSPRSLSPMSENKETKVTDNRRWIALYVLCAGVLMIVLDVTVVNVALPSIQNDLSFSQAGLAWVVNAYLIAFGGLLLLAGRFG